MRLHDLKLAAAYWDAMDLGEKTFEIRFNDRGYQKGDVLALRPVGHARRRLTAQKDDVTFGYLNSVPPSHIVDVSEAPVIYRRIEYIATCGGPDGIERGYVVMAVSPCDEDGEPLKAEGRNYELLEALKDQRCAQLAEAMELLQRARHVLVDKMKGGSPGSPYSASLTAVTSDDIADFLKKHKETEGRE